MRINFNMKNLIKNSQKGVSLIMTFFIMIIILAVVLVISMILYSEIRIVRNISNSVASFYASDSGIEKVLYYDRKVVPQGAARGLCSMFDTLNNPDSYCRTDGDPNNPALDHSVFCNPTAGNLTGDGCNPETCNNCEIDFSANLNLAGDKNYVIKATVAPSSFDINSTGSYKNVSRAIQLFAQ